MRRLDRLSRICLMGALLLVILSSDEWEFEWFDKSSLAVKLIGGGLVAIAFGAMIAEWVLRRRGSQPG